MSTSQVRFRSIGKRFPGVVALHDVNFEVAQGSCHALMGENGAGKSTLGKILAGIHQPDTGQIEIGGVACRFRSPLEAQRAGIAIVHQELVSCPNLSVAENLCLSALPHCGPFVRRKALSEKARLFLDEVGAECDAREELGRLKTAQEQLVQIATALATGAHVLVMDEPTSSLSIVEARRLRDLIRKLQRRGTTILYVTHRMDEVFEICDTVTVLRDGEHVGTKALSDTCEDELVRMMVGRPLSRHPTPTAKPELGPECLRVEGLSSPGKFEDITFAVRAGEVLGLAGLVGAGRSEIALAVFGLDRSATGRIFVEGKPARIRAPRDAMKLGIGLVPEDRKKQGLVLDMSCGHNISLSLLQRLARLGLVRRREERQLIAHYVDALGIRTSGADAAAASLSGGNQQKLVLAKWLARHSRILILDEPTRGVDVGAKGEIHRLVGDLVAEGRAVLLISSELPELLALSTRILVLREGRAAGLMERSEATQEKILDLMGGGRAMERS